MFNHFLFDVKRGRNRRISMLRYGVSTCGMFEKGRDRGRVVGEIKLIMGIRENFGEKWEKHCDVFCILYLFGCLKNIG